MRLITNEKLEAKEVVNRLKEPMDLYIEALDPDNDEDPSNFEPDDIYEELHLADFMSQLGTTCFHNIEEDKSNFLKYW